MLTAIRELADAAEARPATAAPTIVAARRRRASRGRARCCRCSREAGRRRRRRRRARRDRARHRRRARGRAAAGRRRARRRELGDRGDPPGALALPLLHRLRRRGRRRSTPTRSRPSSSSSATRCSSSATRRALKVHVHTDDPGRALSLGVARGTIGGVEIANMHEQTLEREERLLHAVADAEHGDRASSRSRRARATGALFESFGARVVDGGRTMNPSTADLLAAIEARAGRRGGRAPEQRERDHERRAGRRARGRRPSRVVPTASLQAGLAALVAFDPARDADGRTPRRCAEAARGRRHRRRHGRLARRRSSNGVASARARGSGSPTASRSRAATTFDEVARAVLERLLERAARRPDAARPARTPPPLDGLLDGAARRHPELELEVHEGGQPHYPLLLARPSDRLSRPIRVVLVEDNDGLPRDARAAARPARRDRGRRQRRDRRRGGRALSRGCGPTSC